MATRNPDPRIGKRVELHPATDRWMRGDRFGTVVGIGRSRAFVHTTANGSHVTTFERPLRIKLDRSGDVVRFHPKNANLLNDEEAE